LKTDTNGLFQTIEISEDDEHLMRTIIRVRPALTERRVKEVRHKTVGVATFRRPRFKNAGTLELSQTFQFVSGKTTEEIQNDLSIDRKCVTK